MAHAGGEQGGGLGAGRPGDGGAEGRRAARLHVRVLLSFQQPTFQQTPKPR